MSDHEPLEGRIHLNPPGFCVIPGCSGESTTTRRLTLPGEVEGDYEVCWKHAEGELDLEGLFR